jgi:hypothetical protein
MTVPNLYWNRAVVSVFQGPTAVKQWFNKAKEILLARKLQNVKINPGDVNGYTSVAVMFVQLDNNRCVAIVASTGANAKKFCDDFITRIKNIVRFD